MVCVRSKDTLCTYTCVPSFGARGAFGEVEDKGLVWQLGPALARAYC